jgi:hypothetical protein
MFNKSDLDQFIGTQNYYQSILNNIVYTDGVQFLAQNGAGWLVTYIITSQLNEICKKCPSQIWKLDTNTHDKSGVITCEDWDSEKLLLKESIQTDFPIHGVTRLYVLPENHFKVILLSSEY